MKLNMTLLGILAIFCIVLSVCAVSANDGVDHNAGDSKIIYHSTFMDNKALPGGGVICGHSNSTTNTTFVGDNVISGGAVNPVAVE